MDVDGVVVVVEVNGKDNMEFGMEDIEENTEDIVDGSHKFLANLVAKIGFGVEMVNVASVPITLRWMCISLKLSIRLLHHIRLNRLPWSFWSYITLLHWQLTCSIVLLVNFLQPW